MKLAFGNTRVINVLCLSLIKIFLMYVRKYTIFKNEPI
jgi:hypothetical protein